MEMPGKTMDWLKNYWSSVLFVYFETETVNEVLDAKMEGPLEDPLRRYNRHYSISHLMAAKLTKY